MRTWPQLRVLSRWEAVWVVNDWPTHVLAVVEERAEAVLPRRRRVPRHVELFADIVEPSAPHAVERRQVERIIDFARDLAPRDRLLIHCAAGISRSSATALTIWCALGRDPAAALRSLLRVRPQADPNPLVLSYADELLFPDTQELFETWWAWVASGREQVPRVSLRPEAGPRTDAERAALIERSSPWW